MTPNEIAALAVVRDAPIPIVDLPLRMLATNREADEAVKRLVKRGFAQVDDRTVSITDAGRARLGPRAGMR